MKLLLLTFGLYLGLVAVAHLLANRLIFLPPRSSYSLESLPVRLIPGPDGNQIAILHLQQTGAPFTIIYSHGNAEDIGNLTWLLDGFRSAGFSVLAYDPRGYGASSGGPPTTRGATRDLRSVYEYALHELGIPASEIILLGRSVGSGPAVELAASEAVGGLIVESGFVGVFQVVTRIPLIPFQPYPNVRRIRDVQAPVLVIHGVEDEVIPFRHGRRLFEAAPERKWSFWVAGAGHNDLIGVAGADYWRVIQRFAGMVQEARKSAKS